MPLLEIALRCEQCHQSSLQTGVSIKRCSKCGIAGYCSVHCQTIGWKSGHKIECRKPEQLDNESRRAVSRLRFGTGSGADDSKLYYLRISRPWIKDICISGPFPKIQETFTNIALNLRFSRAGMQYFEEMCMGGLMEQVLLIRAPLDADKDKEILIEILLHNDARLKKQMPCPVYNVVCIEPAENIRGVKEGPARLQSMELVGSFTSEKEAEASVKEEADEQATRLSNAKSMTSRHSGAMLGAVSQDGKLKRIIHMVHDSGVTDLSQQYVELHTRT